MNFPNLSFKKWFHFLFLQQEENTQKCTKQKLTLKQKTGYEGFVTLHSLKSKRDDHKWINFAYFFINVWVSLDFLGYRVAWKYRNTLIAAPGSGNFQYCDYQAYLDCYVKSWAIIGEGRLWLLVKFKKVSTLKLSKSHYLLTLSVTSNVSSFCTVSSCETSTLSLCRVE